MEEIWKDIAGYEGLYQVSTEGRVRSLKNKTIKLLKPYKMLKRGGYLEVGLRVPGIKKNYKIHRLVAEAFIPNPEGYNEVNHKDENKENNCVNNLEWCSHSYNNSYGTKPIKNGIGHSKKVEQYSMDGILLKTFNSQTEAARETNSTQGGISDCCRGKIKSHNGFVWKYGNK